jgi:hypothetical protein
MSGFEIEPDYCVSICLDDLRLGDVAGPGSCLGLLSM